MASPRGAAALGDAVRLAAGAESKRDILLRTHAPRRRLVRNLGFDEIRQLGDDYFDRLNTDRLTRYQTKRLAALGYTVTLAKRAA